ncbi:MAG: hypothetical protein IH881_08090 [Myxococcales bacterium]|nr:hypothetical protein [Myxococcales bacterium]MCH7867645.1 hypothetical protein [Myxococcales bacterium]
MILGRHRLRSMLWLPCVLTLLASPTAAFADDWDDEGESFYFDGSSYFSIGYSYLAEATSRQIGQPSKGKGFHTVAAGVKHAEGLNAVLGKRIWEYIAIESQFEYADGFRFVDTDGDTFKLKVYTTTVNAKIFPLHNVLNGFNEGRLQPHLLTGLGLMVTKDLDIKTGAALAFRAGGGIDYFVSDRWAVNFKTSYVIPVGLLKGLRFVSTSIGLSYQLE